MAGYCPFCHKDVAFSWTNPDERGGSILTTFNGGFVNQRGLWTVVECPNCKGCVLVHYSQTEGDAEVAADMYPSPLPQPTDLRVPEQIRTDIDEAKKCFSVRAYRGCATMCRRALQAMCIDKGAKISDLKVQIDDLAEKHVITEDMREWGHSARWVGNDAAHPNAPPVTEEDARDILSLAEQIATIVYVMSAIAEEKKKVHGKNATT